MNSPPMPHSAGADSASESRQHRRALAIYAATTVLFAGSVGYLAVNGFERSLDMTGGADVMNTALGPRDPGYEAVVRPTPVHLLAVTTDSGDLVTTVLVSQPPGETQSTILVLPLETVSEHADGTARLLPAAFAEDGVAGLRDEVENAIGFAVTDAHAVSGSGLANVFTAPVHILNPDTIYRSNGGLDREIAFTAGPLDLSGSQVVDYLQAQSDGESPYNRFNRVLVFWDAVAAGSSAVPGKSGPDGATDSSTQSTVSSSGQNVSGASGAGVLSSVPGDPAAGGMLPPGAFDDAAVVGASGTSNDSSSTTGLAEAGSGASGSGSSGSSGSGPSGPSSANGIDGATGGSPGQTSSTDVDSSVSNPSDEGAAVEILKAALSRSLDAESVGVTEVALPIPGAGTAAVYKVDRVATDKLLPSAVPFPSSAFPGQRVGVKLLNGTTTEGVELRLAGVAVAAGGDVMVIGNGKRMDEKVSTVIFDGDEAEAVASALAAHLGVNAVRGSVSGSDVNVVATVGADQL